MIEAFLLAFGVIFVAELGDKSQFVVLAFASRFPARDVLVGVTLASSTLAGASVLLGATVAVAVPSSLLQFGGGVVFLVFALLTLRDADDDEEAVAEAPSSALTRSAVMTVAIAFFLAELGDKTMLAAFTLGGQQDPLGTWLGATAGEVAVAVLAIVVGRLLGKRLPADVLRYASAAAFAAFGVVLIGESLGWW